MNHQNFAPYDLCPCCSSSNESFLHLIGYCTTYAHLWHASGLTFIVFFSMPDVLSWLKKGLNLSQCIGPNASMLSGSLTLF